MLKLLSTIQFLLDFSPPTPRSEVIELLPISSYECGMRP